MSHNYFEDYGYDSCSSRGVCSISTRMASILEVVILYLKEFAHYALKLEQLGVKEDNIKNLILNTLSAFVSNPEIPDNTFASIICAYAKELEALKNLYIKSCEERAIKAEILDSEFTATKDFNVINSIRIGEQNHSTNPAIEHNKDIRSVQELLFFSAKSIAVYLLELNSYGEDSDYAYTAILELLDSFNISNIKKDDIKAILYSIAEEEFAIIKRLDAIKRELYGSPTATEVSLSTHKGKALLVEGSNTKELEEILEATKDTEISIYTHGKLISAHLYPKLRNYKNLKGHFGRGSGNSILDFSTFPGAIFVERHSIDNIENLYRGRIFTNDIIVPKGVVKIENLDYKPLVTASLEAKGFKNGKKVPPIKLNYEPTNLMRELEDIDFEQFEGICLITQGNDYYEDTNYFDKLIKLLPRDVLIINFSSPYNEERVLNINAGYELNAVFKTVLTLKNLIDIQDKPIISFVPRCDKHITNLILNLKLLGIKKVFMGKCPAKNISPNVVEEFCKLFDITRYGFVKEDYKLFIDYLAL